VVERAIACCGDDEVEEIRLLGRTLAAWRAEILEHHRTGTSNGPNQGGHNLCTKKIKRCGLGFRRI
jgi:transposase